MGTDIDTYEAVIEALAAILAQRDCTREEFELDGARSVIAHTNQGGSTNTVKNPLLVLWDDLNLSLIHIWISGKHRKHFLTNSMQSFVFPWTHALCRGMRSVKDITPQSKTDCLSPGPVLYGAILLMDGRSGKGSKKRLPALQKVPRS